MPAATRVVPTAWICQDRGMTLQHCIDALEAFSAQRGVSVLRSHLSPWVVGRMDENRIVLCSGLSKRQQLLTLVHELTHFLAHRPDPQLNRTVCEYEAEAVEKLVACELGLEDPQAAIDLNTVTDDLLACSVTRVRWVARTLVTAVREKRATYGADYSRRPPSRSRQRPVKKSFSTMN
jgi:hypothetical protein